MQKADIHLGEEYALREPVVAGGDFQRVKVLEHIRRSHWRVEWIDPNPGLVDYVTSNNLIVPWRERRAFLRDEQHAGELDRASKRDFPGDDHPVAEAVGEVLELAGEHSLFVVGGVLRYEVEALERVAARAQVKPPSHPAGYSDRFGISYLPFSCALELAQAFASAEPQTVLDAIDAEERRWSIELREPGNIHLKELLTNWRARWAVIRQWAGHDAAVAARESRICDLEQLLVRVMWDLRRSGVDPERVADRIDRALKYG